MPYLGDTVRFKNTWTDYNGNALDPDSQEARIYDGAGNLVATKTDSDMTKEDDGVYFFDFELPESATAGTWKIVWKGTKSENDFIVSKYFSVSEA